MRFTAATICDGPIAPRVSPVWMSRAEASPACARTLSYAPSRSSTRDRPTSACVIAAVSAIAVAIRRLCSFALRDASWSRQIPPSRRVKIKPHGHWREAFCWCQESLRLAGDLDGHTAIIRRTVAEPAPKAHPPAVRDAAGGDAAGVVGARAHHREGVPTQDGHGGRAAPHRAAAELAVDVVAPAVRGASGGDAASVAASRAHRHEGVPARDGHGRR